MSIVYIVAAATDLSFMGALPADRLRIVAEVAATGATVRHFDFGATSLDFGLFADCVQQDKPEWIVLPADTAQIIQAYRIGRFVRGLSTAATIVYCGAHSKEMPQEAFTQGAADLVIRGDGAGALNRLLTGADPESVPNVLTHVDEPCDLTEMDAATSSDGCRVPLEIFDLQHYRIGVLHHTVPHAAALGVDVTPLQPASFIAETARALAAPDRIVYFHSADLLSNRDRLEELCEFFRRQTLVRWIAEAAAPNILRTRHILSRLRSSGCVALICHASGPGDGAMELEHAAEALRTAGLVPVLCPIWLVEGETISSLGRMAAALQRAARGAPVVGSFFRPAPGTTPDGIQLAQDWNQFSPDFPVFLPHSLLNAVPRTMLPSAEPDPLLLAHKDAVRLRRWLAERVMLPAAIVGSDGDIETLATAAMRLLRGIDGKKTVAKLLAETSDARWSTPLLYAGLALLVLLDMVRDSPDTVATPLRMTPPPEGDGESTGFFCSRPWTGFEVGEEDGLVRMCCWARESYGDVNKSRIAEIWNGPVVQEMRHKMAQGRFTEICRPECPYIAGWMSDEDPAQVRSPAFGANLLRSREEIARRAIVLDSLPRYWKVTHSTLCNLDCVMCYQDRNNKQTLPDSFYTDLRRYYPTMQELLLLGGEPLVTKRIRSLLETFPTNLCPDVQFALITNGTIYDRRTLELAAAKPFSWVVISIDAATRDTYARIRRRGNLDKTLSGVSAWKSLGDRNGFPVVLSFTVMKDNLHELAEFVALADQYGVDCQFSLVNGVKGDQHLIDGGVLQFEAKRALKAVTALAATARMPIACASLAGLRT